MAAQVTFTAPNMYQVHGCGIHVSYSTTGIDGKPHFAYQDAQGSHSFSGDQITVSKSPIGELVTVTIRMTVDTGSTSFSLLVPVVNLTGPADPAPIKTEGITTVHRFSVVAPFNKGQIELYTVTPLVGTASHFLF
jgi:hypothetical protein